MAIDTNGRPTVADVYRILTEPEHGILVTIARIDSRLEGVETSISKHNEIHAGLNAHIAQLQTESDERRGEERADEKHLRWTAVIAGLVGAMLGGACALIAGVMF